MVVQGGPGTGQDRGRAAPRGVPALQPPRPTGAARGADHRARTRPSSATSARCCRRWARTRCVLSTIADLFPGVSARPPRNRRVARIKGRTAMTTVIANAVLHRQAMPSGTITVALRRRPATARWCSTGGLLIAARDRAWASRRPHNRARAVFVRRVIDGLVTQVARAARPRPGRREPRHRGRSRCDSAGPAGTRGPARTRCAASGRCSPPQRLLADLLRLRRTGSRSPPTA